MNDKDRIAWLETEVAKLTRRLIEYFDKPTIRDHLAMAALPALRLSGVENEIPDIAEDAYRIADAMLEARKAK